MGGGSQGRRGRDIEVWCKKISTLGWSYILPKTRVLIQFMEAVMGCKKDLTFNIKDKCDSCNGSGAEKGTSTKKCMYCNGSGTVV